MNSPTRILFVCLGNICRSPAGENVMRHLIEQDGLQAQFEVDSAGTADYHIGNPADPRMIAAARRRGIVMTGRARQVKVSDFSDFYWIFAMDRSNYEDLLRIKNRCKNPTARLVSFCDFCKNHSHNEVPDPYYGGLEGFDEVLDLLEDGCAEFLRHWKEGTLR